MEKSDRILFKIKEDVKQLSSFYFTIKRFSLGKTAALREKDLQNN